MKYVVEIRYIADAKEVGGKENLIGMWTESGPAGYYITDVPEGVFPYIQELDNDYINQNYGDLQDLAFCHGFELARRIALRPANYEYGLGFKEIEKIFGTGDLCSIFDIDPLVVKDQVEAYEAEKARVKAAAKTGKADKEALDKAAAKAVEAFRKLGANYVQIAQAVTKAMAEAVEAES